MMRGGRAGVGRSATAGEDDKGTEMADLRLSVKLAAGDAPLSP